MKAYIISLEEPIKKNEYLRTFGIDPVWVKGLNGNKDLSKEKLYKLYINSSYVPKSAIGCALSHIKVWKDYIERNNDNEKYIMIFEDDVVLEENFQENMINSLINVPSDYDILYLGCFGCDKNNVSSIYEASTIFYGKNKRAGYINSYISIPEIAYALHGYILSKKGAMKLLELLKGNIDDHIDMKIHLLASNEKINTYVTTPRLAYQTSTDTGNSENIKAIHPSIITSSLRHIELDKMVKGDYIFTVSFRQVGDYIINGMSFIFLLLGILCAFIGIKLEYLSLFYLILSLPDFKHLNKRMMITIIVNYLLFIIPSLFILLLKSNKSNRNNSSRLYNSIL
jgi:GR25 family glycosyltransferase involved in LPS biosynthesis